MLITNEETPDLISVDHGWESVLGCGGGSGGRVEGKAGGGSQLGQVPRLRRDPSGSRGADSCRTKAPLRAAGGGARSGDAVGKSAAGSDIWDRPVKNKQPERALLLFPWVPAELLDSPTGEDCRHGLQPL
ncbi:hypothetical protein ANANG_G00067890 [Anguilla anguilla]|uniref:Uncharacterized protein n=1 Tax=Anguilla anguilla TaxID=7936 RepID=A0A9D3S348_ANGAN|nr:hypothetical protein ANANG_G00067890 [Anguilla anguilla]